MSRLHHLCLSQFTAKLHKKDDHILMTEHRKIFQFLQTNSAGNELTGNGSLCLSILHEYKIHLLSSKLLGEREVFSLNVRNSEEAMDRTSEPVGVLPGVGLSWKQKHKGYWIYCYFCIYIFLKLWKCKMKFSSRKVWYDTAYMKVDGAEADIHWTWMKKSLKYKGIYHISLKKYFVWMEISMFLLSCTKS